MYYKLSSLLPRYHAVDEVLDPIAPPRLPSSGYTQRLRDCLVTTGGQERSICQANLGALRPLKTERQDCSSSSNPCRQSGSFFNCNSFPADFEIPRHPPP